MQHVTPDEVTSADAARAKAAGFPRALAALRLTRLFATRMVATLDASQLRAQVYARGRRYRGDGDGGSGGGGGRQGETVVVGPNTIVRSKVGGEQGVAAVAITEGREEREPAAVSGRHSDDDPVVALLASLVALCIAEEEKEEEGRGGVALSVEGFTDVQLEGVSLLLVLLGTQAYGPPPSSHAPSMRAPNSSPQASDSQGRWMGGLWTWKVPAYGNVAARQCLQNGWPNSRQTGTVGSNRGSKSLSTERSKLIRRLRSYVRVAGCQFYLIPGGADTPCRTTNKQPTRTIMAQRSLHPRGCTPSSLQTFP